MSAYDVHAWRHEVELMNGENMFADDIEGGVLALNHLRSMNEYELRHEIALMVMILRTKAPPVGLIDKVSSIREKETVKDFRYRGSTPIRNFNGILRGAPGALIGVHGGAFQCNQNSRKRRHHAGPRLP